MTANYLEMEKKLASTQAKIEKLSTENTSLNDGVKKIATESIEVNKQLKMVQADLVIEKTLNAQKDDHLAKAKKEVEDAIKNFKASDEYQDKLMKVYADGFELLQKYLVKHYPDLKFSSLDLEEVEKEMLTSKAEPANASAMNLEVDVRGGEGNAGSTVLASGDATVVQAYTSIFLGSLVFEQRQKTSLSFSFVGPVCFWHETIFYVFFQARKFYV